MNSVETSKVELEIYPRLKGKTVVITGASSGIGRATAVHFAACGSNLILLSRRLEVLEKLKTELVDLYKVKVHVDAVDVAEVEKFKLVVEAFPPEFQQVDILVNNAGLALTYDTIEDADWLDIMQVVNTNVIGLLAATKLLLPRIRKSTAGHVINIGSVAGKEAYVKGGIYCASKFAVEAITDTLRKELVDTSVRVTKICPGLVSETDFSSVRLKGDTQAAANVYKGFQPLVAADIADNVLYVASRPAHVQIADILVFPTAQASASLVHKNL
jgi:NADP-dependent 3-hydroxy acid dehydrogenase YdfG